MATKRQRQRYKLHSLVKNVKGFNARNRSFTLTDEDFTAIPTEQKTVVNRLVDEFGYVVQLVMF